MGREKLCEESDLLDGQVKKYEIGEYILALARIGEKYYCVDDTCSHGAFSLSEGDIDSLECTLECPKHGGLFDLKTGEALTLPATRPVEAYEVFLENGGVYVEL